MIQSRTENSSGLMEYLTIHITCKTQDNMKNIPYVKSLAGQLSLVITYLKVAYSMVQANGIASEANTGT
jgi:hypothetical protein